jgi:hypothetical protein
MLVILSEAPQARVTLSERQRVEWAKDLHLFLSTD